MYKQKKIHGLRRGRGDWGYFPKLFVTFWLQKVNKVLNYFLKSD